MPQTPATRWCPTTEQLMILEEIYRTGLRTPTAPQIEEIRGHLSFFGRIEGKNVFYWFQNHKARERQRLRNTTRVAKTNYCASGHQLPQSAAPVHHKPTLDFLEGNQGMDLLAKLEADGSNEEDDNGEWISMMDVGSASRDLQTLDLFPVNSTGLRYECSSSKSSCSTSTN